VRFVVKTLDFRNQGAKSNRASAVRNKHWIEHKCGGEALHEREAPGC
jgi:hypothetical protein